MKKFKITVEYCPKCKWMLRAAWIAQELLITFEEEIDEISLKPSDISGIFRLYVNDKVAFDRKENGGFAEPKTYKQLIRNHVNPLKSLGHSEH
jgi:selenoprotein W-related protein